MAGIVGDAGVQYSDWQGTFAADDADFEALEKTLGVGGPWVVVGFSFFAGGDDFATLTAYVWKPVGVAGFEDRQDWIRSRGGRIPVVEVSFPFGGFNGELPSAWAILGRCFKRLQIRGDRRHTVVDPGHQLEVVWEIQLEEGDSVMKRLEEPSDMLFE